MYAFMSQLIPRMMFNGLHLPARIMCTGLHFKDVHDGVSSFRGIWYSIPRFRSASRNMTLGIAKMGLVVLLLTGAKCDAPKSAQANLEQQLIGKWEGVSTLLTIESEGRTGKTRTISVGEGEWETRMNRTTPRMTYFADHRYQS